LVLATWRENVGGGRGHQGEGKIVFKKECAHPRRLWIQGSPTESGKAGEFTRKYSIGRCEHGPMRGYKVG